MMSSKPRDGKMKIQFDFRMIPNKKIVQSSGRPRRPQYNAAKKWLAQVIF